MRNMNDIVKSIKKTSKETTAAMDPMQVLFGEVTSVSPLKILIEQRLEPDEEFFILTRAVRDYEVEMTVDHVTEETSGGGGEAAYAAHAHGYVGRKKFTIHNGLIIGDKVKLLRVQDGQRYVVFDKE